MQNYAHLILCISVNNKQHITSCLQHFEPYNTLQQAREFVEHGHRMEAPEGTPKEVYDEIMCKCWLYEPEKRPAFSEIVTFLKTIIVKIIEAE